MLFFVLDIDTPSGKGKFPSEKIKYKLNTHVCNPRVKGKISSGEKGIFRYTKGANIQNQEISEIFREYYCEILDYCTLHTDTIEDAEEIAQDVFVLYIQRFDSSRKKSARGWLYKTASLCLSNYKSKKEGREKILIAVSYNDIDEKKYNYTLTYTEDLFKVLKNALSKDEMDFFVKYFLRSTNSENNCVNEPLSGSIKTKKCRLKKKILKILEENDITF